MRTLANKLSPTGEFAVVIGAAFELPIASAMYFVAAGHRRATVSNGDLVQLWLFEIVSLCFIVLLLRARGWSSSDFEIAPSFANTLWGVVLLGVSILAYWSGLLGGRLFTGSLDFAYRVRLESTASLPFVVVTSIINPFFEEVLIVGYVLRALRTQPAMLAVGTSALIRLLYHLYEGPLAILGVLPLGIIFATFYWRRRQLWPLVVAHGLGDLIGLVATAAAT